jgi:competence ComEA-like helix-hairpin-helix protein
MYALGCGLLLCMCCMHAHNVLAQPNALTHQTSQPSEQTGVVNLNTASADELERLPRIGAARAQAILALRAQITQFSKLEQLLRVKGIGRATFRKLRPLLTLSGPTTLLERKRAR